MSLAYCAPQRSGRSTPTHTTQPAQVRSTTSAVAPPPQPAMPILPASPLGESPACLAGCARAHTPAKNSRNCSLDSRSVCLPQSWLCNRDASRFHPSLRQGLLWLSRRPPTFGGRLHRRAGLRPEILLTGRHRVLRLRHSARVDFCSVQIDM